jgi:hypothetical protein
MLRRTYGPNTDKVKGCWIKVNNEDAHNLYPFITLGMK